MNVTYKNLGSGVKWEQVREIIEKQKYRCAYTNEELILGLNASIDHICPVSKSPELKHDIDNIQWVTKEINFLKNKFTEKELFEYSRKIYFKLKEKCEGSKACGEVSSVSEKKCRTSKKHEIKKLSNKSVQKCTLS